MKRSEWMKLSELIRNSGQRRLTPDRLKEWAEKTEITVDTFYQEIEMDSPFAEVWWERDFLSEIEPLHSHSFYEILYCTEGDVQYLLGTSQYHIGAGDLIVIPPDSSHRRLPFMPNTSHGRYGLWVSASWLASLGQNFPELAALKNAPSTLTIKGTAWESLETHFSNAWQETLKQPPFWKVNVHGEIILLLAGLCRAFTELVSVEKSRKQEPDILEQILSYIEANLSEKITLADTAHHFLISESYITHLFCKRVGLSFYRYVTQRRLIAAKTLIREGIALEQVSQAVGFTNYSNFYRAFTREYGIAPSQYRARFNVVE